MLKDATSRGLRRRVWPLRTRLSAYVQDYYSRTVRVVIIGGPGKKLCAERGEGEKGGCYKTAAACVYKSGHFTLVSLARGRGGCERIGGGAPKPSYCSNSVLYRIKPLQYYTAK